MPSDQMIAHTLSHPGGEGPFPTIVALHGYGANEHDLIALAPHIAEAKALMVFPRALVEVQPGMFSWYEFQPPMRPRPEAVRQTMDAVWAFIDEVVIGRYEADPKRMVVLGFSQGGGLAYRLGFDRPERWLGVAASATSLPEEIGLSEPLTRAQKSLPLFIQHGAKDMVVRIEEGRRARERLEDLGNRPEYREYRRMAHGINDEAAENLSSWLERTLWRR